MTPSKDSERLVEAPVRNADGSANTSIYRKTGSGLYVPEEDIRKKSTSRDTDEEEIITGAKRAPRSSSGGFIFSDDDMKAIGVPVTDSRFFERAIKYLEGHDTAIIKGYKKYGDALKKAFQDSVLQFGWDTRDNPFLHYVKRVQDIPAIRSLPHGDYPLFRTIFNLISNRELILTNQNLKNQSLSKAGGDGTLYWLWNPDSYDARTTADKEYKIKVLAFLSTGRAKAYGDTKTRPFEQVVKAQTAEEIRSIMNKWNTRDGTGDTGRAGSSSSHYKAGPPKKGGAPRTEAEKAKVRDIVDKAAELIRRMRTMTSDQLTTLLKGKLDINYDPDDYIALVARELLKRDREAAASKEEKKAEETK